MAFLDLTANDDNFTLTPGQASGKIVRGLAGNDIITGSADAENIQGNEDNDIIFGGGGKDTLSGNQGDDQLTGGNENTLFYGGQGNDIIQGGSGDDILHGGKGNDNLLGGGGNDFLDGGLSTGIGGRDVLEGEPGHGNDVFVLRSNNAFANFAFATEIVDFNPLTDKIGLTGGLTEGDVSLVASGGDTLIRLGAAGNYLGVVDGVAPGQLTGHFTSVSV